MSITRAIRLAAEVHDGQTDKGGEEYILHVLAVMQTVDVGGRFLTSEDRYVLLCAAVLHDVIEDFNGSPGERSELHGYIEATFGRDVYLRVLALTKKLGEPYDAYIERVAKDRLARRIKIADLTHNMDTGRLPEGDIGEKDYERWDKYRRALVRLKRED